MAWLETCDSTNLVDTEYHVFVEELFYTGGISRRTITEEKYSWVGVTQATAEAKVAAIASATVLANAKSENNGGGWRVDVVSRTVGSWTTTTTTTTTAA